MPRQTRYRALLLLFAFVLLGCALTAQLQEREAGSTPTPALALASPVATDLPMPSPTLLSETSVTPIPAATPLPPTPSLTPSLAPTAQGSSGQLRELAGQPDPLPENVSLMREPVSQADRHSAAVLADSVVPVRDLRSLAIRLGGVRADVPAAISDTSPNYELGTVRSFKVHDDDSDQTFLIEADLRYKTAHVYMWVETGVDIEPARLQQAADTFERDIYPTNRAFFGSEWTPGVDGDPHLSILHARGIGSGVAGYYWSADEYPAEVRPDSNQMEMFYINADNANVGSAFYLGTLAHEFQHMIHWYNDRNEETWLNEGMSELASLITGFDPGGSDYGWSRRPDTQLNTWSDDDARSAHYGGSYLFAAYLLDRFGETLTQAVVANPANGIPSIDAVLEENNTGLTFTDVFADWVVASYLDRPELADGRFGYDLIDTAQPVLDSEHDHYPAERVSDVAQYGVDYIYLKGGQDLTVDFFGETRARLLSTEAHSGSQFWYSNRGDDSDMRLTRRFDLSGLSQATLRFWTWYDIEDGWDYGYVMVSSDEGATWSILKGNSSTDTNPHGNSYGWGYTGRSGDGPVWVEETIPLDDFAGQQILVRFEYITDDALNSPGWAIDDISIPELGYLDDVEAGTAGWQTEGFVQTGNFVPQEHLVQLILFGREITVERLPLLENQSARWLLPLAGVDHAVLTLSGLAEVTTEPTRYFYQASTD